MLMSIMWMMTALVAGFMAGRISMYGLWDSEEEEPEKEREEQPAESCRLGKAARSESRKEGTYQKRHFGEVHGSERGEEPSG